MMWFRNTDAQWSHGSQQVVLVGVSLSLAYLIALLTSMNRWVNFWLRGSYYLSYQAIFLTLLMILFLVRLSRHHNGQLHGISMIIFGGDRRICRRIDRVSLASDFPAERPPSCIGNTQISSARSSHCFLLVSCETPELALRRHHRRANGGHQSAVRHVLAWAALTAGVRGTVSGKITMMPLRSFMTGFSIPLDPGRGHHYSLGCSSVQPVLA